MTAAISSTVSHVNLIGGILGLLLAFYGLAILIFSAFDIKGLVSKFYEMGKNWHVSFWAVSRNSKQFRAWLVFLGAGFAFGGAFVAMKMI